MKGPLCSGIGRGVEKKTKMWDTNNTGQLVKKAPPGCGSDASAMDAIIAMITVTTVH